MNSTISRLWKWFLHPPLTAPPATVLIRLMVGAVFLWEGIGKFVFVAWGSSDSRSSESLLQGSCPHSTA